MESEQNKKHLINDQTSDKKENQQPQQLDDKKVNFF